MGKKQATLGTLDGRGIVPVMWAILRDGWSGVLRVRAAGRNASVWFVKGQVAHALLRDGKNRIEGLEALENTALWIEGTFMLDAGELPPARTIRLKMEDILASLKHAADEPVEQTESQTDRMATQLTSVLDSLRERVPGLESLSVLNGALVEATTAHDLKERGWLNDQLRSYCDDDTVQPEKFFMQQGDHSLLILKRGQLATVLSARTGTAPEAMFWAGEEARKRVLTVDQQD